MATRALLERERELGVLTERVQAARAGAGGFVLVEGPAGVGKTRLLEEAREVAAAVGTRVLAGRGSEMEREFAYGVVRQLFEPALGEASDGEREEWLSGAAEPARSVLGSVTSQVPPGDFATLHGLYWLAANMAQHTPLLLMVDDLQWADAPSLRFVTYLLHRLEVLPIAAVAASRPWAREEETPLLRMMSTDPSTVSLRPRALSREAATELVNDALGPGTRTDEDFVSACHDATAGNPLLLRQLIQLVRAEGIEPVAGNAAKILELGPKAVSRYVGVRLHELTPGHVRLARSVAVLGDGAELQHAAAHAGLSVMAAADAARELQRVTILAPSAPGVPDGMLPGTEPLAFCHPLIRATVYADLDAATRMDAHARAADILGDAKAAPQHIAAHLLHIHPGADPRTVTVLRAAADDALARGSPDSASIYLRRCLEEPPPREELIDVLVTAGTSALMINTDAAVAPLRQALAMSADPLQRTQLSLALGGALTYLLRTEEASEVYEAAAREADTEESRRLIAAATLSVSIVAPHRPDLMAYADEAARWTPHPSPGGRTLEGMLGFIRTCQGDPEALAFAQRAGEDQLANVPGGEPALVGVWWTLLAADRNEVMDHLNEAVAWAHRRGSVRTLAPAYDYRGLAWLWRGQLAEAEADSYQAMRAIDAANIRVGRPFNSFVRAEQGMWRGELSQAADALRWADVDDPMTDPGQLFLFLGAQARLQRLQGEYEHALTTARKAGQRFAAHGGLNPAVLPWRSEAALNLLALDRVEEARGYAEEELALARQWGAPRALGRALRVTGLVQGGQDGLATLTEAVAVLDGSPARLEYAHALIDLGAAVRRAGQRGQAQEQLRKGADLAQACGAAPLVQQAMTELRMTGARPRRIDLTGPKALTPSERRVADLAAEGCTNRDIAQRLFITIKTVEVHLTNVYRKLNITRRAQIERELTPLVEEMT
ncbi:AAA family ATPase [Streptomyces sp. NPDC051976]|uniref:helix-turn-helix transcriptional regulator n=1 Tax=Streptomyces sp. NPDC051976 TaxID=3154947 RepID=UPI00343291BB